MNAVRIGIVVVLAVVAAVVANVVLLGVATGPNDPVGKLSPRAGLVQLPPGSTTVTTTTDTTPTGGDGRKHDAKQDD